VDVTTLTPCIDDLQEDDTPAEGPPPLSFISQGDEDLPGMHRRRRSRRDSAGFVEAPQPLSPVREESTEG
jgi:hypothetical protein